jgi:hypothetical protein
MAFLLKADGSALLKADGDKILLAEGPNVFADTAVIQGSTDDETVIIAGLDSEHDTVLIESLVDGSYRIVPPTVDQSMHRAVRGPKETEQREIV